MKLNAMLVLVLSKKIIKAIHSHGFKNEGALIIGNGCPLSIFPFLL
jgi:hypothetical protein